MKTIATLTLLINAIAFAGPPDADRAAILAMAGKFKVQFQFRETLAFQTGYELKPEYKEDAHELVVVAEDEPRRIALQHLLVVPGHVVHHWRQVWTFEDSRVNEFKGANAWKIRKLTADEARGTWTQLVTQVDNSPRYESWGRWNHEGGASRWVSGDTWRPLPRREHKKRSDYDVIGGINTHILSAGGWAHEQSNTKLKLQPDGTKAIVRESGFNTYTRDESFDFSPAVKFWEGHRDFSNAVASAWLESTARNDEYRLEDDIEVSALRDEVKDLEKQKLPVAELRAKAAELIARHIRPLAASR